MDDEATDSGGAAALTVSPAGGADIGIALALIEALLAELGDEGQEFARVDRDKLEGDLEQATLSGRFLALLARDATGAAKGVLTLSASFAVYAGGEYGVIDEMYVLPEWRGRGVGGRLVEAAVRVARERRWFRLDVTGPGRAEESAGVPRAADGAPVGLAAALPDGALRFYQRLGFEPTGHKLRLLV